MKKLLILFVFIAGFQNFTFSQDFSGGMIAGMSVSQVDGDSYGGYNKAGLVLGAFVRRDFKKKMSGQIELKYIGKGSTSGNPKDYNYTKLYDLRLHYIVIPVLFQYEIVNNLRVEGGPGFGFLLKSVEQNEQGVMPDSKPFNKFELSGALGVDYAFWERFNLNIRFSYSMLPVRSHAGDATYYANRGQYNNVLEFILGVRIGKNN